MADIVLTTFNARYAHASLALRYLVANLDELAAKTEICEFILSSRPQDAAEEILAHNPQIVGISVYIWNVELAHELVTILKAVAPEVTVVLGGPEVSHELELQPIVRAADYTICGEADLAFRGLCRDILDGTPPRAPILRPPPPAIPELASPYSLYTDEDIANRNLYVEVSRGCPFSCEFCLSSLDKGVREFELTPFLADLDSLIERGARNIKFIDRTFNLKIRIAKQILEFFLERVSLGIFIHFEMVPDRLPAELRSIIEQFPAGSLQFELGIQTFNDEVAARISRRQNVAAAEDNIRFLREQTGVHVHADLIVGLPGETIESFALGFDRLVELGPQEIQVGILKRLRGTPIVRHDQQWNMVYATVPPYDILSTSELGFAKLKELKRFARAWDLCANSGNFREATPLLWQGTTPFVGFVAFSSWLFERVGHFTGIALERLTKLLLEFLTDVRGVDRLVAAQALARDYIRPGRRLPAFLAELLGQQRADALVTGGVSGDAIRKRLGVAGTPPRQARHL